MITIAQVVADILQHDDLAMAAARRGWLNLSAYARTIQPQVEGALVKEVQEASIITALSRATAGLPLPAEPQTDSVQSLAVHSNLEGVTYERSEETSAKIREIYHQVNVDNKAFLTVTQGINEVTIVAEASVARVFRQALSGAHKVYDKRNLVGITVKFAPFNLEVPNLIFALTRRLAYKDINIIEVVSTATELTYIIERKNLSAALEQLQKDI
ncbi:MAG TPA: hypothetical protein VLF69_03910 [Candidatus Saccharimonadales bacterium]|nr:hypothetical protein [Candidatus Saccharimonadales bacterium]